MDVTRMDYEAWDDVIEWENLLKELKDDEEKLLKLKKHYEMRELEILNKTDFNKIYNKNNDKVRKYHVRKVLKNTVEYKENLELKINHSKKMIEKAETLKELGVVLEGYTVC